MATLRPAQSVGGLSFLTPSWTPRFVSIVARRHEASYQRTRKRLKVKPHPSFLRSQTAAEDHIIFNPPASIPSVYHTPPKFLPPGDRRRQLFGSDSTTSETPGTLAAPVRKPYQKKYHLKEKDIEEMRRLRKEDPIKWTRSALAKKFDCSALFVALVCPTDPKMRALQNRVLDAVRSTWGTKRRMAREDRARRKELWGRDA